MSDVNMVLLGDTNVGRPDPDSAFASAPRAEHYNVLVRKSLA